MESSSSSSGPGLLSRSGWARLDENGQQAGEAGDGTHGEHHEGASGRPGSDDKNRRQGAPHHERDSVRGQRRGEKGLPGGGRSRGDGSREEDLQRGGHRASPAAGRSEQGKGRGRSHGSRRRGRKGDSQAHILSRTFIYRTQGQTEKRYS